MTGRKMIARHGTQDGFTLVETLFSIALFSMAIIYLYSTFVVNTRMYIVENEVLEMQQSTRTAADEVSRAVYMAGAGVPPGAIPSDMGFLYVVMPGYGGPDAPDTMRFLKGDPQAQTLLNESMPDESAILKVDDASMFSPGDVALIQGNTAECGESIELFQITQVSTEGQNTLEHRRNPPWNQDESLNCIYLSPATITKVQEIQYSIDYSDPGHPVLVKSIDGNSPEPIAMDIENLKVTFDLLTGQRGMQDPFDPNLIRKINYYLVGRTPEEDPRWSGGVNSLTGQPDGYRRYKLRTQVYIRNMES